MPRGNGSIPAIETRYAGCRFRSRLEARWAVFFDAAGVRWEYERQGFTLPSGAYLPDFWMPRLGVWVEVKGRALTPREERLLGELEEATGSRALALVGDVPRPGDPVHLLELDGWGIRRRVMRPCGRPLPVRIEGVSPPRTEPAATVTARLLGYQRTKPADIAACLTAARSARFEHGESP